MVLLRKGYRQRKLNSLDNVNRKYYVYVYMYSKMKKKTLREIFLQML